MSYQLKSVTMRAKNSLEGLEQINDLWKDIFAGKIPILLDTEHKIFSETSPISEYSNYSSDENGEYDLTIIAATGSFFQEIEEKTARGLFRKYEVTDENGDVGQCTKKAWEEVWSEQKAGLIKRIFTADYERTVPKEFSDDGSAHCYLYIAVSSPDTK